MRHGRPPEAGWGLHGRDDVSARWVTGGTCGPRGGVWPLCGPRGWGKECSIFREALRSALHPRRVLYVTVHAIRTVMLRLPKPNSRPMYSVASSGARGLHAPSHTDACTGSRFTRRRRDDRILATGPTQARGAGEWG